MKTLKIKFWSFLLMACMLFSYGCSSESSFQNIDDYSSNLGISSISYNEKHSSKVLELPSGAYMPDNPNFDVEKPETWTGNMAQYVKVITIYSISCNITNSGGNTAYDTEIDMYYKYDNGEDETKTIFIGDIDEGVSVIKSISLTCKNKKLIECSAEAFWND